MNLSQTVASMIAALKVNARLRWGVLGIVGIVWLYGVLELRDAADRQRQVHTATAKKIARSQAIARQAEWPERLEQAHAHRLALEQSLWREGSLALAQASFSDWLTQAMQQAGLTKPQLAVAAQEEEKKKDVPGNGAELWKVSAKLAFDFKPETFYAFMQRIVKHDKKVAIESLVIRSTPVPKAEVLLTASFLRSTSGVSPVENIKSAGR